MGTAAKLYLVCLILLHTHVFQDMVVLGDVVVGSSCGYIHPQSGIKTIGRIVILQTFSSPPLLPDRAPSINIIHLLHHTEVGYRLRDGTSSPPANTV